MHFHPFGIPVDEIVQVVAVALQTPVSVYVDSAVCCVRGICEKCSRLRRRNR